MMTAEATLRLPEPIFAPPPLPSGFPRWKHFAWDGWDVTIPVDWDLGALAASPKGGSFRLDDEFEPRLTVKWEPVRGRFDPRESIVRYLRKRTKSGDVRSDLGAPVPGIREAFRGLDHETYVLSSPSAPTWRSWGISAYCHHCRRAFMLEMSTDSRAGDSERLVARLLGSVRDHAEGQLARWEAYGLSFDLPAELHAAETRFHQGFVSMAAAERGRRVEVARWTLAGTHLARTELRGFLAAYLARTRHARRLTIEDATVLSHPGLELCSPRRMLDHIRTGIRHKLAIYRPAHLTGLIWHCAVSNRILMLTLASNHQHDIGTARLLASRVRCCKVFL
jgi:hypothetical protein